jgi:V8-like Glu-specific endopeptidase
MGTDGRTVVSDTTAEPYKAIAYFRITEIDEEDDELPSDESSESDSPNDDSSDDDSSNPYSRATAVAFSTNAVITAAHVIENCTIPESSRRYELYFGRNDTELPYGSVTGIYEDDITQIIIPQQYNSIANTAYDYAILVFNRKISNYYMGFSTAALQIKSNVFVCGYPIDTSGITNGMNPDFRQWVDSDWIVDNGTHFLRHLADTTDGQSGSPIYKKINGNYCIVGIHTSGEVGSNKGKRVDSALFSIMNEIRLSQPQ